ncbi:MAG: insulinase family protein [Desulfobacteraceae bacterium]|nr:insulinase family protein [Desulfobacteraceae bacterium]
MKTGDRLYGYVVNRVATLKEQDSVLIQLEHEATGAQHIHIQNKDLENTFAILFRTVPEDSTGVAHILEHTVLCGSRKFNVKDPFFSMLKRGLSTFMNAFTSSDWTMYPFSTQNFKDYYNLADVYLDAAFFPKIDELSFKQEGHRLELVKTETGEELAYKGVVYNEMKGAMSSPSEIMARSLLKALYPSTTYHNNSGGEPSDIPKLSHKGLKTFHSKFYHPSNAFFYTYGSFKLEDHLKYIDKKVLSQFNKKEMDTTIGTQPRWKKPKKVTCYFPLSKEEKSEKKYQACVAWLTADTKDFFEVLVLIVLEQILLGNAASPLRKALIDSGIGSDLCDGTGFDSEMRDTLFAVGLKEIKKDSIKKVEQIIFQTLKEITAKGINKNLIDSAIHQIEFARKEKTNTPYPFGIKLFLSFAGTWIHNGDPVNCIEFDKDLKKLKTLTSKGGFLEKKIEEYFINNPHRVLFTLAPDHEMEQKEIERTKKELALTLQKIKKENNNQTLKKIIEDAEKLARLQESEEDLSSLPCLELTDVPPDIEKIAPDNLTNISEITCYKKPTSGILYFTCPVGIGNVKKELLPLIPFFSKAFINSGTKQRDYAEMAEHMDLYTGGVAISPYIGTRFSNNIDYLSFLSFQGKSLDRNIGNLFNILREFISYSEFSDYERLKQLLYQSRAQFESSIVGNGHRYAISLASRNLTYSSGLSEIWSGITQYQFIKNLIKKIESKNYDFDKLSIDLKEISSSVFQNENLKPAAIGQKNSLLLADREVKKMKSILSKNTGDAYRTINIDMDKSSDNTLPHEGWSINTSVSFTAQAFQTVRIVHEDSASLAVISRLLRSLYLHREIREKGGAYGGFALYNSENGIFSFASYRDPNIQQTLDTYLKACDFIRQPDAYSDDDIKEAILQVCADIDKPETPGPSAIKAFYRDIVGLSDEIRENFKQTLLKTTKEKIKDAADKYFDSYDSKDKGTVVISSKEMLEKTNKDLKKGQKLFKINKI